MYNAIIIVILKCVAIFITENLSRKSCHAPVLAIAGKLTEFRYDNKSNQVPCHLHLSHAERRDTCTIIIIIGLVLAKFGAVLAMASSWAVSTYPEDVTFTYNWTIKDFNKAMERTGGKIDSPSFTIPGLSISFNLHIENENPESKNYQSPIEPMELMIDDVKTPISSYFSVHLCAKPENVNEAQLEQLFLSGSLDLRENNLGVEANTLTGQIYNWLDHHALVSKPRVLRMHAYEQTRKNGMIRYNRQKTRPGWIFETEKPTLEKDEVYLDNEGEVQLGPLRRYDFYTLGDAATLVIKAVLKIATKMVSFSGSAETVDIKNFTFKSFLRQPSFSDVSLQCGERLFSAHKVLLANK